MYIFWSFEMYYEKGIIVISWCWGEGTREGRNGSVHCECFVRWWVVGGGKERRRVEITEVQFTMIFISTLSIHRVQCYWWDSRVIILKFFKRGVPILILTKWVLKCILGWWVELKIRRGISRKWGFWLCCWMSLIFRGGGQGEDFCGYVVGCVCVWRRWGRDIWG